VIRGGALLGKVCHIKGAKPTAKRYDASQTDEDRHGFDNLIILCSNHYDIIDADEQTYTVERLSRMKREHEERATACSDEEAQRATNIILAGGLAVQNVVTANQSGGIAANVINVNLSNVLLDQRPWIEVIEVIAGPLTFDDEGGRLAVAIKVKSVGKTPACDVKFAGGLYLIGKDHMDVLEEQEGLCGESKNWKASGDLTLFKDRETILEASLPIPQSDMDQFNIEVPGKPRFIAPVLIGCINYASAIDNARYQTGFIYAVAEGPEPGKIHNVTVASKGSAAISFDENAPNAIAPERGDIPRGRVSLTPWLGGGFFAK